MISAFKYALAGALMAIVLLLLLWDGLWSNSISTERAALLVGTIISVCGWLGWNRRRSDRPCQPPETRNSN
jgi:hypothetical protein